MTKITDDVLKSLIHDRERLLQAIAPTLRRVGASNPNRAKINARASVTRKRLRKELRANAEAIVVRVMELFES